MIRLLCCGFLLASIKVDAAPLEPYLRVDSFSQSDPVAIHSYITRWQGNLKSGSDALTHTWFESGACYGPFCAALVQRLDYEIKASRDAAVFYYQVRNHLDLPAGQPYALDLRIYNQRSRGLRLSYRGDAMNSALSYEVGLSVLDALSLTQGQLAGQAVVNGPKDYDFNAQVSYFYSKDALFSRQVATPSGEGYSLDTSVLWRINDAYSVHAQLRDLYGALSWRGAPYTTANATSATKHFDSGGYVTYDPTVSGVEGNSDYRQRLHPHALIGGDWNWSPADVIGLRLRVTEVKTYASLRAERRYPGCLAFNAELMPIQRALGIGVSCGLISLSVLSDSLRFEDAHVLQLNFSLAYRFAL